MTDVTPITPDYKLLHELATLNFHLEMMQRLHLQDTLAKVYALVAQMQRIQDPDLQPRDVKHQCPRANAMQMQNLVEVTLDVIEPALPALAKQPRYSTPAQIAESEAALLKFRKEHP